MLYTKLAAIYDQMYRSIFDYDEQFRTARRLLKPYHVKRILELGCGSGNLARRFSDAGYQYTGMDIAKPMLRIARRENPQADFVHGDMRRFTTRRKFDAVLVAGRGFAYMTRNKDVLGTLTCIRKALRPKGVLVFDNFDAATIFKDLWRPQRDEVRVGKRTISRLSRRTQNLETGWTWNWSATYIVKEGRRVRTFKDRSVLRAFTRDELALLLALAGFSTYRFRQRQAIIHVVARL